MKKSIYKTIWYCGIIILLISFSKTLKAQLVQDTEVYRRIKNTIDQIWLVDTHEHLPNEEAYLKRPVDFLARMLPYVDTDLMSAGMPQPPGLDWGKILPVADMTILFSERWSLFSRYWKETKYTSFGRALQMVVNDIYGLDINVLTPVSCQELNNRIAAANTPGLYRRILKDKARIELSIDDVGGTRLDREFFVPSLRFDNFVMAQGQKDLESISQNTGIVIHSLEDMMKALETAFEMAVNEGIVAVKSGLAYQRRIYYPRTTEAEAEESFNKILGTFVGYARTDLVPSKSELEPYQNYMMHKICQLAAHYKLPFQIHTGFQFAVGNIITNSKATDLVNLIMEYPDVKFDIFHGSFPYSHELGTMAKNFPNVYIDMCFMQTLSPKVARDFLSEWIESVPANKILGFGADYGFVEGAYGQAQIAREMVATVLTEKVISGYLTEEEANELALKVLRTNAIELFNLPVQK